MYICGTGIWVKHAGSNQAVGLQLFADEKYASDLITAIKAPENRHRKGKKGHEPAV